MDTGENETLKKKDFLLSNYMQWNETLQAALVKEHILGLEQSLSVDVSMFLFKSVNSELAVSNYNIFRKYSDDGVYKLIS